ncbi:MAG TPA: hypothetical protein VGF45_01275 [Polyangia bacterium]
MSMSDVVKSVVLGGALMSRCGGSEPPPPPPPVVDAGPAPQDAVAPPDTSVPVDAGAPDLVTAPDVATVPDAATTPDVVPAPDSTPLPPAKPVNVVLNDQYSYFFYAYGGGAGCNTAAGPPYLVEITNGSVCVPEGLGKLVSLPLDQIRTCNGDTGCIECAGDPGCQPATCFAPLPASTPGEPCSHTLRPVAGAAVTRYMLFPQKPESTGEEEEEPEVKQGLPKILTASDPGEITITPPPGHATFVMGRFGKPVNVTPSGGGECGETGLCTILPLTFAPIGPTAIWDFWGPTTFWAWSLF